MANEFDELKEKAKRVAAESAESLQGKLESLDLDGLKAAAEELADGAAAFVKRHPVPSVLGALAAGFLLGTLLSRRRE